MAPASPIAKVAVGIPYGICTIDNKLSSPFISLLSIGTPNTGILVNEATIPGRWAAPPAPAIITLILFLWAFLAYLYSLSGVLWAETILTSLEILKSRKFGYDGKGQHIIKKYRIPNIKDNIEKNKYIIEGIIKFKKEISVIVIIKKDGSAVCYEPSENKHANGILRESVFPAAISKKTKDRAKAIAVKLARSLNIIGIIAIEMFVDKSDEIIVNEVAPRPHNSGHWTLDACNVSQFEALVRVIFDMPMPHIKYYHKCKMINILGENYNLIDKSLYKKNHKIYVYGKDEIKEARKLGHINILS